MGCKCSHSVCQLTLSHTAFYITSQKALLRQQDLLENSVGLGVRRDDVLEAVMVVVTDGIIVITVVEKLLVSQSPWRLFSVINAHGF